MSKIAILVQLAIVAIAQAQDCSKTCQLCDSSKPGNCVVSLRVQCSPLIRTTSSSKTVRRRQELLACLALEGAARGPGLDTFGK